MKKYKDITELSKHLLSDMLSDTTGTIKTNAYHKFDVLLETKNCIYDVDLGLTTGHTKVRWTRLVNQYVDKARLGSFVNLASTLDKQCSVSMLFKQVESKKLNHQYGNCLLGVCYYNKTLMLFSRTCFVGYMSYIDLALAHKIAQKIGDVKDIKLKWYVSDLQLSYLRSLPVIFLDPDLMTKLKYLARHPRKLSQESIGWQRITGLYKRRFLYHYHKSGIDMLDEAKYGPIKKFIQKWLILQGKIEGNYPKSVILSKLEL